MWAPSIIWQKRLFDGYTDPRGNRQSLYKYCIGQWIIQAGCGQSAPCYTTACVSPFYHVAASDCFAYEIRYCSRAKWLLDVLSDRRHSRVTLNNYILATPPPPPLSLSLSLSISLSLSLSHSCFTTLCNAVTAGLCSVTNLGECSIKQNRLIPLVIHTDLIEPAYPISSDSALVYSFSLFFQSNLLVAFSRKLIVIETASGLFNPIIQ